MKRILLLTMVVFSMAFALTSCAFRRVSVTAGGEPVRYHYWYYPETQIYFDYEQKVYYYPENGSWRHSQQLPARYSAESSHVVVDEDTDKPYVNHERHVKQYPSTLRLDVQPKGPKDHGSGWTDQENH